jgi:hypothetical protein
VHLNGFRFIVLYAHNVIEIQNFSDPQNPVIEDTFEFMDTFGMATELDYYLDEQCIIVGFLGDQAAILNMRTKAVRSFDHRLPEPMKTIMVMRNIPGGDFFMLSKGGTYRVWDQAGKY